MGKFLESEKENQKTFKADAPYFTEAARAAGHYCTKDRAYCLPVSHAKENLYPPIRDSVRCYFADHQIKWHQGRKPDPSNHMCDSQVCCVNFLYPFAHQPTSLATLLRPHYPTIGRMLPMEDDHHVAFEWIGKKNYMGEVSTNGVRTRGANYTSADAAVMFEHADGQRQIVLIEWKYCESYYHTNLRYAKSGTDRTTIYRHLYQRDDCPFHKHLLPSFETLFYEPFYQLMRQQFLAHEMELAHELDADIVTLLHIAPAHNQDFCRVTSPALEPLGGSPTAIWSRLTEGTERFRSVSTERLFGRLTPEMFPAMEHWLTYIRARYGWVCNAEPTAP